MSYRIVNARRQRRLFDASDFVFSFEHEMLVPVDSVVEGVVTSSLESRVVSFVSDPEVCVSDFNVGNLIASGGVRSLRPVVFHKDFDSASIDAIARVNQTVDDINAYQQTLKSQPDVTQTED